jgi:hypothetical protein
MPCGLVDDYQPVSEMHCFHLQGQSVSTQSLTARLLSLLFEPEDGASIFLKTSANFCQSIHGITSQKTVLFKTVQCLGGLLVIFRFMLFS